MKKLIAIMFCSVVGIAAEGAAEFDSRMADAQAVVTNGLKWIDGKYLPLEGRWTLGNTEDCYYARLPNNLTTNVNGGVRSMRRHTSGMQFRFRTDSKKLAVRWQNSGSAMNHMPATGVSGIDVYTFDAKTQKWRYLVTGRPGAKKDGWFSVEAAVVPGTPVCINLPLYNGIDGFELGIDPAAKVSALEQHKSGVVKPVVFYGTSITHGGCASRPGLAFVNIIGRDLDVPVHNLGFSGCGRMEYELSGVIAKIDASCYVLDCLWNMNPAQVEERYEPFIRNLRKLRPDTPIVMAEGCDVFGAGPGAKDKFVKALYDKLIVEGWKNLVYLPKTDMYTGDSEGTVDGCHPNDWGMMSMAKAFGEAVREALGL